jgi:hypothetical protein
MAWDMAWDCSFCKHGTTQHGAIAEIGIDLRTPSGLWRLLISLAAAPQS